MTGHRCFAVRCLFAFLTLSMSMAWCDEVNRLVADRPVSGRFVKTDAGYMVPFKATIPGTEIEFEMVPVPAADSLHGPTQPFWIGKYEVTLREFYQYAKLYRAFTELQREKQRLVTDENETDAVSAPTEVYDPMGRFVNVTSYGFPAYSMTLYAAKQYTKWLSLITSEPYRLPTEAEWEHAARAGGTGYYWKKSQLRKIAVFGGETEDVVEVGTRQPNDWGVYDIYGNVAEWVITDLADPQRNAESQIRLWPPLWVSKGGHYASKLEDCLAEQRMVVSNDEWSLEANFPVSVTWLGNDSDRVRVGFRIVRALGELDKEAMQPYWEAASVEVQDRIDIKLQEAEEKEELSIHNCPKSCPRWRSEIWDGASPESDSFSHQPHA